ncbi:MAG: glucoamylase family protein, partial [Christensenellales bacterium]
YNCSVLYDSDVAKTIFTGFREVDSYVPSDMNVCYLGAYKVLDKDFDLDLSVNTLRDYFTVVSEVGSSTGADEDYVAEKASQLAKNNGLDISDVLFDYKKELKKAVRTGAEITLKEKNTNFGQKIYALSIFLAAAASATAVAVFFDLAVGILSFLPFVFIAENIINYALYFLVDNKNPPEMNFKTVPHNHRTAVVVSEFISSVSQFAESYGHVRKLRASNGGENVSFCLLVDTKGGERPVSKLDEEIIEYVKTQGKEEDICVFLRKKTFINGVYCGKERKRGALNALNKYFVTGNGNEFDFISNENIFQPKYIVTIDSDNSLLTGDVTEMVNIIAHPYNKKYDIMALHSRYDLYSLKTGYSLRFFDECGIEEYPVYSDLFYRAFGRDIYCGKGIYRVNAFYRKIDDVFPSGRILSHDVIEGAVMTTGGGTTVLEDAPNGFLSDRERKKRWMRGDIQLLPFVAGRWRNDDNKRCKVEIAPLYKYVIFRNALSVLKPLFIFASLLYGLFSGVETLVFALGLFIAPYVLDIVKILRGYSMGTRFRYLMKNAAKKFMTAIEDLFLSGYYAIDNAILFVQTIFRMISGRNLLNWKTYHDSQADKKSGEYVKEFAVPTAVLCAIGLVLVFFYTNALFLALYIIASFFFYYELYLFSKTKLCLRKIDDCDRKKLLEYAEKTYKYFSYMLSYSPLVADNLQIKPYKGISSTTSPTNIGFSLLAQICAYELGFIKIDDCLEAMSQIIESAEKLPKWKGNLYNWYNLNGKPVNAFVSSVDSGNFLASLIVCREFFAERGDDVNELKTELLIINTDISALYDEGKNMFYIGYDGEKFVGHYDILNSESRILTTVYTAYAKNIKNFRCLQRDYCRYGGNTLLSWSGTAFETLMPALFIASPLNSALRNTEKNVSRAQSSVKINGIWGISESGYYDFDESLKYQYYAFGIKRLSLKNEYTVPVVSPYASALCLEYLPKETINNFDKLALCGAVGEYGFYEAVDMRKERRIVCSHMSHHQGMILCAITNYLRDNKLKKLFSSDEKIAASLKNLNEIVPKCNTVQFLGERPQKQLKHAQEYYKNISNLEEYFQTFVLCDADYSSVFTAFGGGYSKKSDIYINKFFNVYEENQGGFFYIKNEDGEIYSPTFLPLSDQCKYNVTSTGNEIVFENTTKSAIQKVALMNGLN